MLLRVAFLVKLRRSGDLRLYEERQETRGSLEGDRSISFLNSLPPLSAEEYNPML